MFYRIVRFGVVVVCLGAMAGWGCSRGPSPIRPPAIDAAAAGKRAIKRYDTDGDGLIRGAELDQAPALKAAIENLDTDGNGGVSAQEITARVKAWQETKVGKISLSCTVAYRGRRLEGATVRFVPEEFLGDEIRTATGRTDEYGVAVLSVPLDPNDPGDVSGVHYGLYRVEITKEDMNIPARYNTETTLGQEVADDCADVRRGINFHME
jgi:hypothetical protein